MILSHFLQSTKDNFNTQNILFKNMKKYTDLIPQNLKTSVLISEGLCGTADGLTLHKANQSFL